MENSGAFWEGKAAGGGLGLFSTSQSSKVCGKASAALGFIATLYPWSPRISMSQNRLDGLLNDT